VPLQSSAPPSPSAANDIVVVAASSGGLDALHTIFAEIPSDFDAAIAVVLHRTSGQGDLLSTLLSGWTALRVRDALEGEPLLRGMVYVAPAECHMTVSADPLFASAALAYGTRCIAVVLTGGDGDASNGVQFVQREGGTVIAENPDTAFAGSMPAGAIATGCVDRVLDLREIAPALLQLVAAPI
jgi:two-component system chemotaxis response regulator CheB